MVPIQIKIQLIIQSKAIHLFMLAVEKDNPYAVDLMLKHGAQLEQSYVKADEGRRVFLHEIAEFFKANQAKELISQH